MSKGTNMDNIKMQFIEALEEDAKKLSHSISSSLAHQISDKMEQEYQYVIERFYSEYQPESYKRHSERGYEPGLNKTFKKYYKNPHNTIYYGGIEIADDNMYDDYHDSPSSVLSSFLNGYHGRASAGIESFILPYKHMLKFRDSLANELKRSDSELLLKAKKHAAGQSYKLIKIK